jgi:hypothetical protein
MDWSNKSKRHLVVRGDYSNVGICRKKVTAMFRGVFGIVCDKPKFYLLFHGFWRNVLTMFCGTLRWKQWSSVYTENIINKLQRSRPHNRQTRLQGWERTPHDEYDGNVGDLGQNIMRPDTKTDDRHTVWRTLIGLGQSYLSVLWRRQLLEHVGTHLCDCTPSHTRIDLRSLPWKHQVSQVPYCYPLDDVACVLLSHFQHPFLWLTSALKITYISFSLSPLHSDAGNFHAWSNFLDLQLWTCAVFFVRGPEPPNRFTQLVKPNPRLPPRPFSAHTLNTCGGSFVDWIHGLCDTCMRDWTVERTKYSTW